MVGMELVVNGTHRVPVRLYTETASERTSERGPYLVVRAFAYVIVEGVGYRLNGNFIARPAQERAPAPAAPAPTPAPKPRPRKANGGNGHTLSQVAGSLATPTTPGPKGSADDWIARMLK